MNTFNKFMGVVITFFISIIVFFMGVKVKAEETPNSLYKIYLNGEVIGLIEEKQELLNLIDREQEEIKEKYNVDKVYPPDGLDIQGVVTYDNNIDTASNVYEKIKDKEPFTISGYKVTISYPEQEEEETELEKKEPVYLNVLEKEDFEDGFYDTIAAFVGSDVLEKYDKGIQPEIVETGSITKNIHWEENIKIKKTYLSTEEFIYTNSSDISKYLLFGTLEEGKKYTVKSGDDIPSVAEANNLNVDEFLVANPNFSSANVLLTAGQQVNTALIDPVVSIVYEEEKVEDIEVPFKTEYIDDETEYVGTNEVVQEGQNGQSRVTEQIQYVNGEIQGLYISSETELTPTINKIVKRGTMQYINPGYNFNYGDLSTEDWAWPTVTPYVITSRYGWRWGKMHNGIDISGCGFGSPIFSSTDGVVLKTNSSCANRGYYGNPCGGMYGNYVYIQSDDGHTIYYAHTTNNILVSVGQRVSKGQIITYMGDSGSSTGTHLHFEIIGPNGGSADPCKAAFRC